MAECFKNGTAQMVHKYADLVLLLLLGALAWWLTGLDTRLTSTTDRVNLVMQQSMQSQSRYEEVLRRLAGIENQLSTIDARIYRLFVSRTGRMEEVQ